MPAADDALPTFGEPEPAAEPAGMGGMGGGLGAEFSVPEPECEAVIQWRAANDAKIAAKAAAEATAVAEKIAQAKTDLEQFYAERDAKVRVPPQFSWRPRNFARILCATPLALSSPRLAPRLAASSPPLLPSSPPRLASPPPRAPRLATRRLRSSPPRPHRSSPPLCAGEGARHRQPGGGAAVHCGPRRRHPRRLMGVGVQARRPEGEGRLGHRPHAQRADPAQARKMSGATTIFQHSSAERLQRGLGRGAGPGVPREGLGGGFGVPGCGRAAGRVARAFCEYSLESQRARTHYISTLAPSASPVPTRCHAAAARARVAVAAPPLSPRKSAFLGDKFRPRECICPRN